MTPIFLKSLVAVAALAISVPAFAAPSTSTQTTVLKYDAKTQKYCMVEPAMTGSRIDRTAAGLNMPKAVMLARK